jgi:hypothetical protein
MKQEAADKLIYGECHDALSLPICVMRWDAQKTLLSFRDRLHKTHEHGDRCIQVRAGYGFARRTGQNYLR